MALTVVTITATHSTGSSLVHLPHQVVSRTGSEERVGSPNHKGVLVAAGMKQSRQQLQHPTIKFCLCSSQRQQKTDRMPPCIQDQWGGGTKASVTHTKNLIWFSMFADQFQPRSVFSLWVTNNEEESKQSEKITKAISVFYSTVSAKEGNNCLLYDHIHHQ